MGREQCGTGPRTLIKSLYVYAKGTKNLIGINIEILYDLRHVYISSTILFVRIYIIGIPVYYVSGPLNVFFYIIGGPHN